MRKIWLVIALVLLTSVAVACEDETTYEVTTYSRCNHKVIDKWLYVNDVKLENGIVSFTVGGRRKVILKDEIFSVVQNPVSHNCENGE